MRLIGADKMLLVALLKHNKWIKRVKVESWKSQSSEFVGGEEKNLMDVCIFGFIYETYIFNGIIKKEPTDQLRDTTHFGITNCEARIQLSNKSSFYDDVF